MRLSRHSLDRRPDVFPFRKLRQFWLTHKLHSNFVDLKSAAKECQKSLNSAQTLTALNWVQNYFITRPSCEPRLNQELSALIRSFVRWFLPSFLHDHSFIHSTYKRIETGDVGSSQHTQFQLLFSRSSSKREFCYLPSVRHYNRVVFCIKLKLISSFIFPIIIFVLHNHRHNHHLYNTKNTPATYKI